MKKWLLQLKSKYSMVNIANLSAIAMVICTVNAICAWTHHQPEVPEEAMELRKF